MRGPLAHDDARRRLRPEEHPQLLRKSNAMHDQRVPARLQHRLVEWRALQPDPVLERPPELIIPDDIARGRDVGRGVGREVELIGPGLGLELPTDPQYTQRAFNGFHGNPPRPYGGCPTIGGDCQTSLRLACHLALPLEWMTLATVIVGRRDSRHSLAWEECPQEW